MDREILFRGKRADNGEWVYGYYTELPVGNIGAIIFSNDDEIVCEDTASYIIKVFEKQHSNYSNGNPLQVIECENYEVIPETVSQFTGRYDKNNKKIFKNDIVKTKYGRECLVVWFSSDQYNAWDLKPIGNYECKAPDKYDMWSPKNLEVVGNIHDYSELPKED